MTRPMKNSGVEWLGEVPESWNNKKINNMFKIIGSGTTPKTSHSEFYDNGTIDWLNTGDLNNGYIIETKNKITEMALNSVSALKMYPKDSLVIAMYGATIGKLGITKIAVATNQACCVLAEPKDNDLKFVFYWLMGNQKEIVALGYGGGQPNISQQLIKNLRIPCPDVVQQQKIASFLDEKTSQIDSILAATKQSIVELKKYKQALITEIVTTGLNSDVKMKNSGIEWVGEIPEHWGVDKLKEVGSFFSAGVDKKIRENESLYKSVHYTDVYYNSLKQIKNSENYLVISATEDKAKKSNLLKGDVLFTTSSETPEDIGHSTVIEEDLQGTLMGYHLIRFRAENDMLLSYRKYAFGSSHLRSWFAYRANGMTRYGLKVVDFLDAPFIITPQEEQQKIADFLDEKCAHIDNLIADKETLIREFETYKKALIYEYVTGKKEVE
ncbi:hypothetical protein B0533_06180 [Sedimentibacter sp. SX930]|nr:hypothetical protein B0533_06180 [Sedimentibacter sp. SX930]